MNTVYIDGQAGTTGLQITDRLSTRDDLELIYLSDAQRKDPAHRQACLQQADIAILCLPDDAAREAVSLAQGHTRIIDASTAFRIDADWVYGIPELDSKQRNAIAQAQFVSNPGCYPQGFILFIKPLIDAGWLDPTLPLRCHAVSGYSGGGRQLIETQQAYSATQRDRLNSQAYSLNLAHKHVPEMRHYSGTQQLPLFSPTVANYYKGMLVQIPLFSSEVDDHSSSDIHTLLSNQYRDEPFINVLPQSMQMTENGYLNATACNDTNNIELMIFGNQEQLLLVARYDNLGKGAAGAAVQNLNIMLGRDEGLSL
ncbi:MAG: N-acetyl-gamma-glutamyl-phosphate reductase [Gammaproteobacteria bacterium]|nr:N-acetyl-gamma-glutamyl-phosphate reductase [Gammaproteobacteria bacterium]